MTILERIVSKVTSGQWILTVAGAFTFSWMAINGKLTVESVTTLLGVVFYAYFNRDRAQPNEPKQ